MAPDAQFPLEQLRIRAELQNPTREHAAALLATLMGSHGGREILVRDAAEKYAGLCHAKSWKPVRWHGQKGVAHALRIATGDNLRKRYRDVVPEKPGGKRQRWMVFLIPSSDGQRALPSDSVSGRRTNHHRPMGRSDEGQP